MHQSKCTYEFRLLEHVTDISVSNTIAFTVTPYPVSVPVITSPSSGSSFILDGKNAQGIVTKSCMGRLFIIWCMM